MDVRQPNHVTTPVAGIFPDIHMFGTDNILFDTELQLRGAAPNDYR